MTTAPAILLTGGSGFVGKAWLAALLADPGPRIHALLRPGPGSPLARLGVPEHLRPRVAILDGDLTLDRLGIDRAGPGFAALRDVEALEVWHVGAATDLHPDAGDLVARSNVEGTRQLLAALRELPAPVRCLNFVSTIGVAGTAGGDARVPEALLPPAAYHCPYEASKHAAEALVAGSGAPYRIFRLPIVVGDSRTGASDDKTIYGLLATLCWLRAGLADESPAPLRVRADPRADKNLICVDDLVAAMAEIRATDRRLDLVYHLTNPQPTPARVILEQCAGLSGLPLLADPAFDPESRPDATPSERELHHALLPLRPYMNSSTPTFARDHTDAATRTRPRPVDDARLAALLSAFLARRPGLLVH
jgi:nucleoside-diphosphate-sugar epimerase